MKYIKYLTLCLLVALVASCADKDVTYQMTEVDNSKKAYVQIAYVAPVANVTANYIYYVDLNGVEYGNSGSSFLPTYNFIPSGSTSRYYVVDAGSLKVDLKAAKKDSVIYSNTATGLEAGKHYIVFVYDLKSAPKVVETPEYPTFPGSGSTAEHCGMRLYNFVYEADGTPMTDKIQYAFKDSTGVYQPIGEPVAFGEASSYFTPSVKKEVFNSSGYETRYNTILRIDATTGASKGQLTYTTSGNVQATFTDYWTLYIGRVYHHVAVGNLSSSTAYLRVKNFTAL